MSENLWEKLEEKMMSLVAEVETNRKKIEVLTQENALLKKEYSAAKTATEANFNKLNDLVSLLETVNTPVTASITQPVLIQKQL